MLLHGFSPKLGIVISSLLRFVDLERQQHKWTQLKELDYSVHFWLAPAGMQCILFPTFLYIYAEMILGATLQLLCTVAVRKCVNACCKLAL